MMKFYQALHLSSFSTSLQSRATIISTGNPMVIVRIQKTVGENTHRNGWDGSKRRRRKKNKGRRGMQILFLNINVIAMTKSLN